MSKSSKHMPLSTNVGLGAGGALVAGWGAYSAWLNTLKAELDSHSSVAQTPQGPLEYAVDGSGPPILITHGILGGWDQGMLVTHLAEPDQRPFGIVSVSRWGYLRT